MMDNRHFFTNAPPQTFMETNDPYSSALLTSMSNDAFALRELIGKLGATSSYESRPHLHPAAPIPLHATDPAFAERAAKFSCFGSRSFNERRTPTTPPPLIGHNRSGSSKLPRVSSTPALKVGVENKFTKISAAAANSDDVELESSVSEQISNEMVSSRKRKGKSKQDDFAAAEDEDVNAKRIKVTAQSGKNGKSGAKMEDEPKPADPPKDYIHVRARRGQATDSHSLAERVRREKISERMKLLQDLVPGCNKVTGKALMLDEIINYVQSLQRQVEFLSMKLATVNPELEADFSMDNLLTKDMLQQNGNVSQEMYPLDSSMYNHNHHQSHQNVQQHQLHTSTGPILDHVVPLDAPLSRNLGLHMPSLDGFSAPLPEFSTFGEDDLQSIVQMGFVQNPINFPVAYQTSNMKVEL